jgi:ABC-type transporter Mla MlaB component
MEWLSLGGDLTRESAVEQLLGPSTSDDADSELCLHALGVERIDAAAAAAFRLRMARHHREHGKGTVTLYLPTDAEVAARLSALLDPAPGWVTIMGQVEERPPANYALVPTTVVEDSNAAVALGGWTLEACERARMFACAEFPHHHRDDGACRQRSDPRARTYRSAGRSRHKRISGAHCRSGGARYGPRDFRGPRAS